MDIPVSLDELKLLRSIAKVAQKSEVETYVVGGYVRDKILGRPTKDIDIVVAGDGPSFAEELGAALPRTSEVKIFKNFGTAYLRVGDTDIEVVGARKESYSRHSRNPEVEPGTLEDDQNRRDFTINALAVSLNKPDFGTLIDPFGGLDDLHAQLIRTPLDPVQTFSDDPLRMLRAVRFSAQLGFEIVPEAMEAMKQLNERISIIAPERITEELHKIILTQRPSEGFLLLDQLGLLQLILPEVTELQGIDYQNGKGHKDNFYHSLEVLDNVATRSDKLWLRWAALLHDIGKTPTKRFDQKIGWTFHAHDAVGGGMTAKIFRRLKMPLHAELKYVRKLVELHLRPISLSRETTTDSAIRRLLYDAGDDIDDLMLLCESDITSKNEKKVEKYLSNFAYIRQRLQEVEEKDHIKNWQPPISGEEIMSTFGLQPSREVGIIKEAIKNAILDNKIDNNYDQAREYMLQLGQKMGLTSSA